MVCDSRRELTSKGPERGRERDAGRENGKRKQKLSRHKRESTGNMGGQRGEVIV